MRLPRAPATRRARTIATALALLLVPGRPALADWRVNGFGFGSVRVRIWCKPNRPPAAPNAVAFAAGFNASVTIPPPAVPGCNPATSGTSTNGQLWRNTTTLVAGGGDWVAAPPSDVLFGLVTPTLPLSTVSVSLVGEAAGGVAFFSGAWSGTDPGDAASLEWYDVTAPTSPVLLASLGPRVGPWSESISLAVPIPSGGPEFLEVRGAAVATSITPEPVSVATLATGLGLLGAARRLRRRRA